MIERVFATEADKNHLQEIYSFSSALPDDFFDYSGVVVQKPWGHEYLIFKNDNVAVWLLFIHPHAQTSFHCHPNKKTSVVTLSGEAYCRTFAKNYTIRAGSGLMFERGVFHSTHALSPKGIYVLETETPTNKKDLVRLHDDYGRERKGYEGAESFTSMNIKNMPTFFSNDKVEARQQFGECLISLQRFPHNDVFQKAAAYIEQSVITLLVGSIKDHEKNDIVSVGDTFWGNDVQKINGHHMPNPIELLIISKIEL